MIELGIFLQHTNCYCNISLYEYASGRHLGFRLKEDWNCDYERYKGWLVQTVDVVELSENVFALHLGIQK